MSLPPTSYCLATARTSPRSPPSISKPAEFESLLEGRTPQNSPRHVESNLTDLMGNGNSVGLDSSAPAPTRPNAMRGGYLSDCRTENNRALGPRAAQASWRSCWRLCSPQLSWLLPDDVITPGLTFGCSSAAVDRGQSIIPSATHGWVSELVSADRTEVRTSMPSG
jgi:hypothetical protein